MSLENAFVLGAEGSALASDEACERLAIVVMRLVRAGKRVVLFAGPTRERADDLQREAARLPAAADAWDRAEVLTRGPLESSEKIAWWLNKLNVGSVVLDDPHDWPIARGSPLEAEPRRVSAPRVAQAFAEEAPVVIVPGGVARDETGRAMSLGTGGTALSAVFAGDRFGLPVRVLGTDAAAPADDLDGVASGGLPRRAALLARDSHVSVFVAEDASVLLPVQSGSGGRAPSFAVRANARFAVPA